MLGAVGRANAAGERLLLELKDTFSADPRVAIGGGGSIAVAPSINADVLNAVLGLGYSEKGALLAVNVLPAELSRSDGIRLALSSLSKG